MVNQWVPHACTLPTADQPLRLAEFDALFADHLQHVDPGSPTTTTLVFADQPGLLQRIEDLTARESSCCSFFRFAARSERDRILLDVSVPEAHAGVLTGLQRHATAAAASRSGTPR